MYTSRKFILSLLVIIASSILVWYAKISDGVFSTIIVTNIGAYMAANVIQKKDSVIPK